jgi:putative transposase
MRTIAAYIDLNAVRAGLVDDPKDFRFCGYGEAVAGNGPAQTGLKSVIGGGSWRDTQEHYRQTLFGTGASVKTHAGRLSVDDFNRVIAEKGKLPLATVLRCRVRYFSDGAVLGSRAFVQSQLSTYQRKTGRRSRTVPRQIPHVTDWGDLTTLRGLRQQTFC